MRPRSKLALWAMSAAVMTACLPGGRLPEMPVTKGSSTLRAKGRGARVSDGPFRVTFAAPDGDEVREPQPQLIFSRPVRALGAKRDEPKLEARFVPDVEGHWEWIGTSAARFVPKSGFETATHYELELTRAPVALDGEKLDGTVKLSFSTPRPAVVDVEPRPGHGELGPREIVRLQFSQEIARDRLLSALSIVDRSGAPVPFTLEQDGDRWGPHVQLKPVGAWAVAERLTIKIAKGVAGTIGDLPMGAFEATYETQRSLGVESIDCWKRDDGRCHDGASIDVTLSGDMRPSDLRARVEITPPVKLRPVSVADDAPTNNHSLSGDFTAGTRYAIKITPSDRPPRQLTKKKGEEVPVLRPLERGGEGTLTFAPAETGVHFSFSGTYVPPSPLEIAARAEETKEAKAGVAPLDRATVMRLEIDRDATRAWDLPGFEARVLPPRASLKDPPAWATLRELTKSPGPLLFAAKWQGIDGEQRTSAVLQRSDLALVARVSGEGTLVWITSLTTGAPLEGVAVEARDKDGGSVTGTTAADGTVRLATTGLGKPPADDHSPWSRGWMVLFAARDTDWIYRRVDVPRPTPPRGALFSDRGLYRPGETGHVKGIVRQPTSQGLVPVTGRDVEIELHDPTGRVSRDKAKLSEWGTFDHAFSTAADAPTGRYVANARLDGALIGSESMQIMEYRPSTLAVDARLDRRSYVRGDKLSCDTSARYLYGGSLDGAMVTAWFRRQRGAYAVPGLAGFTIDEQAPDDDKKVNGADQRNVLDREGKRRFEITLDHASQRGPELVSCDVTVTDASYDLVASSASAIVHPGEVYVALEDRRWGSVFPRQKLEPKVLAVTPDGERRKKKVRVELWKHVRDPKRWHETLPGELVASCDVETGSEPRSCALTAPAGPYDDVVHFVERASHQDARGVVSSSIRLYPTAAPAPRAKPKPRPKTKPRPEAKLEVERETHARGEVAHLTATSPFEAGHMLFTVEREGVIEHRVRAVGRAPIDLDVPIDAAIAPSVRATATFVSPYADRTSPRHTLAASTTIQSTWEADRLEVALRPSRTQASPGEELDVDVDVHTRDGRGARAEVTLYAADEGTLSLARYRLPEPLDGFFARRDASVIETHTRDALGTLFDWEAELRAWGHGPGVGRGHGRLGGSHRTKPPQIRMGATSVSAPRRNFDQGAFFLPTLTTDERGHVRARVKLPESLTTYRVMAFAVTKQSEMGSAQAAIVTSMPLQVRPVLPRTIRAGDAFSIGAMAANNGATKLDATVSIAVDGLSLRGPASQTTTLDPGASKRLLFDVDAKLAGRGKVTLKIAAGDGLVDAAELPITIATPLSIETAALYGAADGRVDEQLDALAGVRADVGGLDVTLSSSPLAGLGAGLEQLIAYPYGCTEQTTSRLVPLLSLRPLASALGVQLPDDLPRASAEAVRRIAGNQQKDGGFGLWPGSTASAPWLSAYATWGLEEAARHGVPVDDKVLARARRHLLSLLARWNDGASERATAPFALDVLTLSVGHDDVDAGSLYAVADQLYRVRASMPLFARAHLLHAMARVGAEASQQQALVSELAAAVHLDGPVARVVSTDDARPALFDSTTRTAALVLRALMKVSPEHPLVTPLALGLVHDRTGGTWRTTQETAWALLALDDYRRAHPEAPQGLDGDVRLGGTSIFHHTFAAQPGGIAADAQKTLPMSLIAGPASRELSFVGKGGAPLYYQARLRFAPRDLPTDDVAAGFELHRRYHVIPQTMTAKAGLGGEYRVDRDASFTEGELVLVELELSTSSPRRSVVVDDPLPGGLESVEVELDGGPRWLRTVTSGHVTREERRDDRVLFFIDELKPGATRLAHLARATVRGKFIAPPAKIEEMYAPETFGRTGAAIVSVGAAR